MPELPLFPLNTVLFPGMPLNLHIFEDRYKIMMSECIEKRQPFGVVLIAQGQEALGPLADPYSIGCSAQIIQVQPLGQGQMNITAVGKERFQIVSLDRESRPYLTGTVEPLPIRDDDHEQTLSHAALVRAWLKRYLEVLKRMGEVDVDVNQVPRDPTALAYLSAVLLQIPLEQKQELLSMPSVHELLDSLRSVYRREVALLGTLLTPPGDGDSDPVSLN